MSLCVCKGTKIFCNYANKFMTPSFLSFLFQVSLLSAPLIPTHLRPQTSNPITNCFIRTHWICCFIYTDREWTPLSLEFLLVLDGTVCRTQREESGALAMPRVYLKVRIVFVLTILTTCFLPWPAALWGMYREEANDTGDFQSVSCFLFYKFVFYLWGDENSSEILYLQQSIRCYEQCRGCFWLTPDLEFCLWSLAWSRPQVLFHSYKEGRTLQVRVSIEYFLEDVILVIVWQVK